MNLHILTCLFILSCMATTFAQPTIVIDPSSAVEPGIDPWNGDLCLFECYPSKGAICFNVADDNLADVTVTASSSNPLVVPINVNNLRINYDASTGEGKLFIFPEGIGQANITITAKDGDWNSTSFYLKLEVKECVNSIVVQMADITILSGINQTFAFKASNQVRTSINRPPMINNGDDIEFIAGNSVLLNPGFEVKPGGEFLADIDDCK